MKDDLLSVVVAAYNVEDYIQKCIDSLIKQTYSNIEILIVNDGSTDNTLNILIENEKKYSNLKVLDKVNGGLSSARNYGLKVSKGKYIAFVDGDDYLEEEAYEQALNQLKIEKSELCIFSFSKVYSKKEKKIRLNEKLYKNNFSKKIFSKSEEASIVAWNKIFLNKIIKENNILFENKAFFEDTGFIFRYLYFIKKISVVNKPLYNYIQRKGSITKKANPIIIDSLKNTSQLIESFYKIENKLEEYRASIDDMNLRMEIYTYRYLKKYNIDFKINVDWNKIWKSKIPFKHKLYLIYIKFNHKNS